MDYNKVERAITTMTKGNPTIAERFEDSFRESISSLDIQMLVSNAIPPKVFSNCLITALQAASTEAKSLQLETVAAQLWNPLTAVLIKQLQLSPPTVKPPATKPSTVKNVSHKKDISKIGVTDKSATNNLDQRQITEVSDKLKSHAKTPGLFNNQFHKHIKCVQPECSFCNRLYHQVNITKCTHQPLCHPTGYYPHVGKSLWNMLKIKHNQGTTCDLKNQPCKEGQIPNLASPRVDDKHCSPRNDIEIEAPESNCSWADEVLTEQREDVIYPRRKQPRRMSTVSEY